eukprot:sb/3474761/
MARRLGMLSLANLNPCVKEMQYAVRGPIVIKAAELEGQLNKGAKLPFEQVIKANIGDAHAMGQKPISFVREVIALSTCPSLMETATGFSDDAVKRAKEILGSTGGGSVGELIGIVLVDDVQFMGMGYNGEFAKQ